MQAEYKPGLIHNKRDAVIALCLTGVVTAFTVRAAVFRTLQGSASHSQHSLPWLFDARFVLPMRAAVAVNIGFYGYLLFLGVAFYRMARGKERVLVVGWFIGIFLGPVRMLDSVSVAVVDSMQALGMMAAFLAAVYILADVSASGKSRRDDGSSRDISE